MDGCASSCENCFSMSQFCFSDRLIVITIINIHCTAAQICISVQQRWPQTMTMMATNLFFEDWIWQFLKSVPLVFRIFIAVAVVVCGRRWLWPSWYRPNISGRYIVCKAAITATMKHAAHNYQACELQQNHITSRQKTCTSLADLVSIKLYTHSAAA